LVRVSRLRQDIKEGRSECSERHSPAGDKGAFEQVSHEYRSSGGEHGFGNFFGKQRSGADVRFSGGGRHPRCDYEVLTELLGLHPDLVAPMDQLVDHPPVHVEALSLAVNSPEPVVRQADGRLHERDYVGLKRHDLS
jgi:hypothetical protein